MRENYLRQLKWLKLFLALSALFVASTGLLSCSRQTNTGKLEAITIGTAPLESSALIYVAENQGFFTDQGLDVNIKVYETGAASLNGLLEDEVDIAVPAEYALVGKALQKEQARAIASIAKAEYFYLVGRRDRGIQKVADLDGKKVGVVRKTIAEFYLGRFLELNGVDPKQVTPVDIDIAKSAELISGSEIDSIISRPPHIRAIEKQMGANVVSWPAQNNQALYAVMVGRNEWIAKNPETIKRLLNSLLQAEDYLVRNPNKAKSIVQERLDVDDAYIEDVWSRNQFAVTLEQSLILALEDQARWMIKNHVTTETAVPDFSNYIHVDGLKEAKPEAVNIIE